MWDNDSAGWLWEKDPCFRNEVPKKTSSLLLLGAQEKRLSAEQDELPCGPKGTSTGNCQETETRMPRACYAPRQSLQKHRSAEQMLDGRRHRVDIPVHARTTSNDLQQKRLGNDLCWIVPHPPPQPHSPTTQSVKGLNWPELFVWRSISLRCCQRADWVWLAIMDIRTAANRQHGSDWAWQSHDTVCI